MFLRFRNEYFWISQKNVVQKLCTLLDKLEKMKSTLEHNPFQLGVWQNIANFKLKWPAMPHMQAMRWEEKKSDIISFMRSFCVNVIWKWSDHRANIRLARRTRISLSNRRSLINFNMSISAPPSLFVFIAKTEWCNLYPSDAFEGPS